MQDNETDNLSSEEFEEVTSDAEPMEPIGSIDESASSDTEEEIISEEGDAISSTDDAETAPKEESRSRRFFRKFIRWSAGLLIVFGLGFLAAIFLIYNPKVDELDQSENNLNDAGTTISSLEDQIDGLQDQINGLNSQIDSLTQQITDLETENQELLAEQDGFNLHIALLKARTDVVSAQVELYEENPAQARVLLEGTSQTLTTIETLLPNDLKDVVAPLQNRLELAIGELEDDPETAIADLDILAGDLLEIENALFGD